jgi:hypothetical protein
VIEIHNIGKSSKNFEETVSWSLGPAQHSAAHASKYGQPLSGLVALAVLAAISWHSIDRGDATQGASIICTGAVSIVAVFVTGRLTTGHDREPSKTGTPARDQD